VRKKELSIFLWFHSSRVTSLAAATARDSVGGFAFSTARAVYLSRALESLRDAPVLLQLDVSRQG